MANEKSITCVFSISLTATSPARLTSITRGLAGLELWTCTSDLHPASFAFRPSKCEPLSGIIDGLEKQYELVLENRHILSLFFILLALLAFFGVLGYVVATK